MWLTVYAQLWLFSRNSLLKKKLSTVWNGRLLVAQYYNFLQKWCKINYVHFERLWFDATFYRSHVYIYNNSCEWLLVLYCNILQKSHIKIKIFYKSSAKGSSGYIRKHDQTKAKPTTPSKSLWYGFKNFMFNIWVNEL